MVITVVLDGDFHIFPADVQISDHAAEFIADRNLRLWPR